MATATFHAGAFDAASRFARLPRLAWLLDAQFGLPGTKFRFGVNTCSALCPSPAI